MKIPLPSYDLDDDAIVDDQTSQREEKYKERKRKMINSVDSVWIHSKKAEPGLSSHYDLLREFLHNHIRGALVKLHRRVLQLTEHERLV